MDEIIHIIVFKLWPTAFLISLYLTIAQIKIGTYVHTGRIVQKEYMRVLWDLPEIILQQNNLKTMRFSLRGYNDLQKENKLIDDVDMLMVREVAICSEKYLLPVPWRGISSYYVTNIVLLN